MELSQNAIAFSIESLMSTQSKNENHDRSQTPKIDSRVEECLTKKRDCACDTKTSDTLLDRFVCRATSLLKEISVEDKTGNTKDTSCLTFPRNGFVAEQATPKWKKTPSYFPGELVNTRIYDPTTVENSSKGDRSHRGDSPFLITKYQRRDHPTSIPNPYRDARDNEPPWKGKWETGDENTFSGGPVVEQPISKVVDGIHVSLENSTLWRMFNKCGTEMIVNRIGRRMFPCIATTIRGLDPSAMYSIKMELDSSDRNRYKFINGKWMAVGKADPEPPNEHFEHPDSPSLGAFWMQDKVSFSKLKITNNKETGKSNTVLHSMHKYTPRIIITKLTKSVVSETQPPGHNEFNTPREGSHQWEQATPIDRRTACFEFEETMFIAVTAYHSEQITQLKIQNNPFAKAFRDADVTAILQGTCMLSETKESSFPTIYDSDVMAPIHPGFSPFSIGRHNPASVRQNHSKQNREEYNRTPTDAYLYRRGEPLQIPECHYAPWSFDNVAVKLPGSYVQGEPSPEDASQRGISQYFSQPLVTFDTGSRTSLSSRPLTWRHRHIVGVLEDATDEERVTNKSLSHPEIRFERTFSQPVSTNVALDYNELSRSVGNTGDAPYHALRRAPSAAMHRAAKRNSLPYFSPKKVLFIPKYRSADNAIQKSRDQQASIPRRHSIIEGSSLFRASTGNLRGKSSIEECPPRRCNLSSIKMVEVSTPGKRASLSGSTSDFASVSSANYPAKFCTESKKQSRNSTEPGWDPEPMNLSNTSP